jgi:hypothetical protein
MLLAPAATYAATCTDLDMVDVVPHHFTSPAKPTTKRGHLGSIELLGRFALL